MTGGGRRSHRRRPTGGLASALYAGGVTLGAFLCVLTGHMWVAADTLVGAVVVAWIASRTVPDSDDSTARVGAAAFVLALPGLVLAAGSLVGSDPDSAGASSPPPGAAPTTTPSTMPSTTPSTTPAAAATTPAVVPTRSRSTAPQTRSAPVQRPSAAVPTRTPTPRPTATGLARGTAPRTAAAPTDGFVLRIGPLRIPIPLPG